MMVNRRGKYLILIVTIAILTVVLQIDFLLVKHSWFLNKKSYLTSNIRDDVDITSNVTSKNSPKNRVRVLIWILTAPQFLDSKAVHVKKTWGRRSDLLLFFSSVENKTFPTVGTNTTEGRKHLLAKTNFAWKYIFKHYYNDADWFMKADDDTYVIVENLRHFLSSKNASEPILFGQHFNISLLRFKGYYSGGAGYVLSKAALKRYCTTPTITKYCAEDRLAEDVALGYCMNKLGVKFGNSFDSKGKSRFHCFTPYTHMFENNIPWYKKYDVDGGKSGAEYISDYPISFHYIEPKDMYTMDFLIYHVKRHNDSF